MGYLWKQGHSGTRQLIDPASIGEGVGAVTANAASFFLLASRNEETQSLMRVDRAAVSIGSSTMVAPTELYTHTPQSYTTDGGLSDGRSYFSLMLADDKAVYAITEYVPGGAMVSRIDLSDATRAEIARDPSPSSSPHLFPISFAQDGDRLYWISSSRASGEGVVRSVSKAGGEVTTLGTTDSYGSVAVDATAVYWRTNTGVWRVVK